MNALTNSTAAPAALRFPLVLAPELLCRAETMRANGWCPPVGGFDEARFDDLVDMGLAHRAERADARRLYRQEYYTYYLVVTPPAGPYREADCATVVGAEAERIGLRYSAQKGWQGPKGERWTNQGAAFACEETGELATCVVFERW